MNETLRNKIEGLLYPNKLKAYDLKFPNYPNLDCLDTNADGLKHLVVLASNEKEALLMRRYIIDEGLEG